MKPFRPLSTSDQLTIHLRNEITNARLTGEMPGVNQLVKALGVNSAAVNAALQRLEEEGLLISQGLRRSRLIALNAHTKSSTMKIGMLYYDTHDIYRGNSIELRRAIEESGHTPVIAPKTMFELGMNVSRITRHVSKIDVDAWIIYAGSSEVLKWFSSQQLPAFAIYGRLMNAGLAGMGIKKTRVTEIVVKKLVDLGHKRIVLLVREERRKPSYGLPERFFIEQLEANGIKTGPYNIPDWTDNPEGLRCCLDNLFKHTPPTAVLVSDPSIFHAVQEHLSRNRIIAPENISLFCYDYAESFDWCLPSIAHLQWDPRPTERRVIQWIGNISKGKEDRKLSYTKAEYIDGASIGPAPL